MSLRAQISGTRGTLALQCDFEAEGERTTALLGPNGAGKTTVLRVLAGLVSMDTARVELDGQVWEDTSTGVSIAPEDRGIGFVFQDHALFPHLSAIDNVAFGLRARGVDAATARRRALEWLERLGVVALARSRPGALSGGQAQRVALARALVTHPQLLLLDEPLAAVDATARLDLRRALREHLAGFRGVRMLVTHDPLEAAALAEHVVILEAGRIVQRGTFDDVTARPRSAWVAGMAGLNLLRGAATPGVLRLAGGFELAIAADVTGPALATIHPRAIALYREAPAGSPRNVMRSTVVGVDPEGDRWRIRLEGRVALVAEVTRLAATELHLADGGDVFATIKATEVEVYAD